MKIEIKNNFLNFVDLDLADVFVSENTVYMKLGGYYRSNHNVGGGAFTDFNAFNLESSKFVNIDPMARVIKVEAELVATLK